MADADCEPDDHDTGDMIQIYLYIGWDFSKTPPPNMGHQCEIHKGDQIPDLSKFRLYSAAEINASIRSGNYQGLEEEMSKYGYVLYKVENNYHRYVKSSNNIIS